MVPQDERRTRLIGACPDTVDAVLVTRLVNVRYLTGFSGSNGALLLGPDVGPLLATDGRYLTQAATECPGLETLSTRSPAAGLVERAGAFGIRRLGIEASHVTMATYDALHSAAGDAIDLVALPPFVEPLRSVKDSEELSALAKACEITDAAYRSIIDQLRTGLTETDVEWMLRAALHEYGAEGVAFDSIVGFGPNSAIPHHQPGGRVLAAGDLVKLDFGALNGGYHADMTRTVVMSPAADWQRELHDIVNAIQQACRESCVAGALPRDLDAQATTAIQAAGHDAAHGLGHGVGLEIHEDPFLTPTSAAGPLADSMAVTIEPGIYLPGRGGVRIEDTMVVTSAGARPLTTSPRELLEL